MLEVRPRSSSPHMHTEASPEAGVCRYSHQWLYPGSVGLSTVAPFPFTTPMISTTSDVDPVVERGVSLASTGHLDIILEEEAHQTAPARRSTREKRPTAAVLSPFVSRFGPPVGIVGSAGPPHELPKELVARYAKFLKSRKKDYISTKESGTPMPIEFVLNIEGMQYDLNFEVINLFVVWARNKLVNDRQWVLPYLTEDSVAILDGFAFQQIHSTYKAIMTDPIIANDPGTARLRGTPNHTAIYWTPPESLLKTIVGARDDGSLAMPWYHVRWVVMPCLIDAHYLVLVIDHIDWKAYVYDPKIHSDTKEDSERKAIALYSVRATWWAVLDKSGFFNSNQINIQPTRRPLHMNMPPRSLQFRQRDDHTCGPLACMMIENFLTGLPTIEWGNSHIREYRHRIACIVLDQFDV